MKHRIRLFAAIALVGVGALSLQAYSLWPRATESKPVIVETQPIGTEQGTGGVAHDSKPVAPAPSPAPTQVTKKQQVAQVAPRQAEVQKKVLTEYPYRALRTSNDPLQQPSWSSNATRTQAAWDTSTGSGAVVAVIDTGFALNHQDLSSQWFQNTGETGVTAFGGRCWTGTAVSKSTNNCDDDNNGYVDDWRGWDFVGTNNTPQAGETNPTGSGVAHGTEVAGLVGATGNNGVGTATIAWNNRIMPLQALDDNGSGYTSSVMAAVYYAADNGADVINLSLGGDVNDTALANAIKYAYDRDIVVVAAAGNCGTGSESGCDPSKPGIMSYPALNRNVIAVGATTSTGARASFSSYGPGLDVTAPGSGNLVSPMWQSGNQTSAYASSLYGTSFASPIVASYVGLIKSIRPSSTVDDITALVNATAWKPGAMASEVYTTQHGHGIIDAEAGLRVAGSLNSASSTPELLQAGGARSERSYSSTTTLASGCDVSAGTYCTVWARDSNGYDRYLPYTATDGFGKAGWNWPVGWLGSGDWALKARVGDSVSSTPYILSDK